ncbi:MAG: hypothetical protein Q8S54_17185 [Bacteroidota bacterium]|nr:hypothetical protein [Bacteroidota bacterium]
MRLKLTGNTDWKNVILQFSKTRLYSCLAGSVERDRSAVCVKG